MGEETTKSSIGKDLVGLIQLPFDLLIEFRIHKHFLISLLPFLLLDFLLILPLSH